MATMNTDTLRTIVSRFACLSWVNGAESIPEALDAVEKNASNSKGTRHAARFCLHLWDSKNPFDLVPAYTSWDLDSRAAYRAGLEQAFG